MEPTWPAVGMALIANVGTWLVILKRYSKRVTPNPGPIHSVIKPGEGPTCREHGETLATLVEFKDTTKDALKEIKDDIRQIREAVVK